MTLVPKKGLAAQREKELEEKLEAYRSSLSEEQLDAMVEKTKALEAYQEAGEDPKALECIPNVRLAEAPSHGLPALAYDAKAKGTLAYLALADELLARMA